MAVLGAIVEPFVRPVIKAGGDIPLRCAVGAKLVCDDPSGHETPVFHQPGECPELCVSFPVHAVSDTQASKRSPNIMAN